MRRIIEIAEIRSAVDWLIGHWQSILPEVEIVLGGSLVSGLLIQDEQTKAIDVDVRFLSDQPDDLEVRQHIETVTGLRFRKSIPVNDWPMGTSVGHMFEGDGKIAGLPLPLDIEGCLRNRAYIGWAQFYPVVLSAEEMAQFRAQKIALRYDKSAYKALQQQMLQTVMFRCVEEHLVYSSEKKGKQS